jgi:hypothetical protein
MKRGEIMFLILGLVIIATGTIIFLEASAFQKKATVTEGTVISANSTHFIVKYISGEGTERTHQGTQSKNGKHREGEKFPGVFVLYLPPKCI